MNRRNFLKAAAAVAAVATVPFLTPLTPAYSTNRFEKYKALEKLYADNKEAQQLVCETENLVFDYLVENYPNTIPGILRNIAHDTVLYGDGFLFKDNCYLSPFWVYRIETIKGKLLEYQFGPKLDNVWRIKPADMTHFANRTPYGCSILELAGLF